LMFYCSKEAREERHQDPVVFINCLERHHHGPEIQALIECAR
jgi:hypothetical protein